MSTVRFTTIGSVAISVALSSSASAWAAQKAPRPAQFQALVDCRAVADGVRRLACYDREVAAMDAAEVREELVVIDRAKVRSARKTLFGLTVPDLGIFGGGDDEEGVNRIEARIASVGRNADGRWTFRLADGARWTQSDSRELSIDPSPGQPITIRKAAMGSFLANVNKQVAIRVRRVN